MLTLCDVFINQYQGKLDNLNVQPYEGDRYYKMKKLLVVHVKQSTLNECEDTDKIENILKTYRNKCNKPKSVYIGELEVDQWQRLGVTFGYLCPAIYNGHVFMLGWGINNNSVLLIRSNAGEIVKIIVNVHELHIRHLYNNLD